MTTTAYVHTVPPCPKCAGPMWDQKSSKFWGDGLTKNGKQKPRYECKNKECGGCVWEPKTVVTSTQIAITHPKSAPQKLPISHSNIPDKDLPPLLRGAEAEDNAELYAKVSGKVDIPEPILQQREAYATAQLQTLRIALQVLEPEYRKHEIGLTDDVCHKHAFELLKLWSDKGLI